MSGATSACGIRFRPAEASGRVFARARAPTKDVPMRSTLEKTLALALLATSLAACSSSDDSSGPAAEQLPDASDAADASDASVDSSDADASDADDAADVDPLAAKRANCEFAAGSRVEETLGISAAARAALPIDHVIVLMKENRSFDHVLGALHDQGQPETEAIPSDFSNLDDHGVAVKPFRALTTCLPYDLGHQWPELHLMVNHGKMDGFVGLGAVATGTDGHLAISYYDQRDLPFYYWLASNYALNDRHFPSVLSGTYPNRDFLLLGTADGVTSTGAGFPDPSTPTIFDALDAKGVTWAVYSDGSLLSGSLNWTQAHPNTYDFATFQQALDDGSLPQVAFVDSVDNVEDEHPTGNMQVGEAWTRNVYDHAVKSLLWPHLAMFWTYDEGGGFFDHVPPPDGACIARPGNKKDVMFHELGVRVPFVAISPWARPHAVSHVVQDHTAITRFIEAVFDLGALTARDANMGAALDLFDFSGEPPMLTPPTAPAAGTLGCANDVRLSADKATYASGDPLVISFSNAQGNDPLDRVALYTHPPSGATKPGPGALAWTYVGGAQTPGASPKSGSVTLDASRLGTATWPLPAGGYIAYYLANGGYASLASVEIVVQ